MEPLITASALLYATGNRLGALKRVALRDDASRFALRGSVMAQPGNLVRAKARQISNEMSLWRLDIGPSVRLMTPVASRLMASYSFRVARLLVWRTSSQFVTIETSFAQAMDDEI
jgi:hypothetical protein